MRGREAAAALHTLGMGSNEEGAVLISAVLQACLRALHSAPFPVPPAPRQTVPERCVPARCTTCRPAAACWAAPPPPTPRSTTEAPPPTTTAGACPAGAAPTCCPGSSRLRRTLTLVGCLPLLGRSLARTRPWSCVSMRRSCSFLLSAASSVCSARCRRSGHAYSCSPWPHPTPTARIPTLPPPRSPPSHPLLQLPASTTDRGAPCAWSSRGTPTRSFTAPSSRPRSRWACPRTRTSTTGIPTRCGLLAGSPSIPAPACCDARARHGSWACLVQLLLAGGREAGSVASDRPLATSCCLCCGTGLQPPGP